MVSLPLVGGGSTVHPVGKSLFYPWTSWHFHLAWISYAFGLLFPIVFTTSDFFSYHISLQLYFCIHIFDIVRDFVCALQS